MDLEDWIVIKKTGRCLCDRIQFEVELSDTHYDACHCGMCRRWAGGPFFGKTADSLKILSGAESAKAFRTSDWAERVHCAECGANLWYHLLPADLYMVSVGALDDQSDMELVEEIYIDCKPKGYAFAGETDKKTEADVVAAFTSAQDA